MIDDGAQEPDGCGRPPTVGSRRSVVEPATIDELRRRVYGPEASQADRARYREALQGAPVDVPAPVAVPPDGAPVPAHVASAPVAGSPPTPPVGAQDGRRRRRRVLIAATAVVLVLAIGATAGLLTAAAREAASALTPVRVGAADHRRFLHNLAAGELAGIGPYLVARHGPGALRGAGGNYSSETQGSGPTTLTVSPPASKPGRVTVLLVLATRAHAQ